jgi:hypothetical protein
MFGDSSQGAEMAEQGSLELLHDPVAEKLLGATIPARLAYTWMDGTPRVVPVWFYWTGKQFVIGSPARAPKLKALAGDPHVTQTIDDSEWPYSVLMVRGTADVEMLAWVGVLDFTTRFPSAMTTA